MLKLLVILVTFLPIRLTYAGVTCNSIPSSVRALIQKAAQATVTVSVTFSSRDGAEVSSGGSGFIVNSSGRVASAFHIIEKQYEQFMLGRGEVSYSITLSDCRTFKVTPVLGPLKGEFFPDTVFYDMIDPPDNLPVVQFEKKLPVVGETVYAIGSPQGSTNTITNGTIISPAVAVEKNDVDLILTSNYIDQGNSGGILVNTKGNVLGMNHGCGGQRVSQFDFTCVKNGYFIPATLIEKWLVFLSKKT